MKTCNSQLLLFLILVTSVSCADISLLNSEHVSLCGDELMIVPGTNMVLYATTDCYQSSQTKSEKTTHCRIKFFPKNLLEQQYLDGLEDVSISYVPFGYELVPNADILNTTGCLPIPEYNPYKQIYDGPTYCSSGQKGLSRKGEVDLPVMYAIWPIEKGLPSDIEYVIDSYLDLSILPPEDTRYPLRLQTYDSLLGKYVPLKNIKVRVSYNGFSAYQYTDNTGLVNIYTGLANVSSSQIPNISISVVLAGRKWSICPQTSTTPFQISLGTIGSLWPNMPSLVTLNLASTMVQYEVYRAVEYYHSTLNDFHSSVLMSEENPIIHICSQIPANPGLQGDANPLDKVINIYNVGLSQAEEIAVVLHELGHIRKWYQLGQSSYEDTDLWSHESYACFIGAYLGEQYYLDNGFIKPDPYFLVNTMGQQHAWTIKSNNYYSPFYVDLYDSYNQSIYMDFLPNDPIQGVPALIVDDFAISHTSKHQTLNALVDYVGIYYTPEQMNTFLSNY